MAAMGTHRQEIAATHLRAFGLRLREAREAAGLSQEALAHATGLTPAAISEVEAGKRDARMSLLWLVAGALNVEPGLLVSDEPDAPRRLTPQAEQESPL